MASYRIQHITLQNLADQIRSMCGTALPMTPAEMLQRLQAVKYIPQGWACPLSTQPVLALESTAVGTHPQVRHSSAGSVIGFASEHFTSTLH